MIGCLRTRVRKQPIIALYFEFETVLKFYNLEARHATHYVGDRMLIRKVKLETKTNGKIGGINILMLEMICQTRQSFYIGISVNQIIFNGENT